MAVGRGVREAGTQRTSGRSSRLLALVPVLTALLLGPLLLPLSTEPEDVPLPEVDARALFAVRKEDVQRARHAAEARLPDDVRALGSAIREFNLRQARGEGEESLREARRAIDGALGPAFASGVEPLLALRAYQLEAFLVEVERFEATGDVSAELEALGGTFTRRMAQVGWRRGNVVHLGELERRVTFKITWNALVGLEKHEAFVPTLDEHRVLYRLYLRRPYAPEAKRAAFDVARASAASPAACAALDEGERLAAEQWRLEKIDRLAAIDPAYPAEYAKGIVHFRRRSYLLAAESFQSWLRREPNGRYALRARNYLKTSLELGSD